MHRPILKKSSIIFS